MLYTVLITGYFMLLFTLHGRSVGGSETMVADGGVGLEADVHEALGGLQHGRHLDTTERPQ